jgi:predicted ATPase
MNEQFLKSVRIRNFKAIRDTGTLKLTPFTVLIGNNGSGKSSLVEALMTFQDIAMEDLDYAMQQWKGFENIWNKAVRHNIAQFREPRPRCENPMSFALAGKMNFPGPVQFTASMNINAESEKGDIYIEQEKIGIRGYGKFERDARGRTEAVPGPKTDTGEIPLGEKMAPVTGFSSPHHDSLIAHKTLPSDQSLIGNVIRPFVSSWQFVTLSPEEMGQPVPRRRTGGDVQLAMDGSNVAEFLSTIRDKYLDVFDGIIETLKYVLPYTVDVQPAMTSEIERSVYLKLKEGNFEVPGWLLSTGTLRIAALLALFRHPDPPPLIVIEEIENGLDPRTINLIVGEIQDLVESGRSQVIVTTHSPYFLDLVPLSSIVLVERIDGQPVFYRPSDDESLAKWAEEFSPGRLYTMDLLQRKGAKK